MLQKQKVEYEARLRQLHDKENSIAKVIKNLEQRQRQLQTLAQQEQKQALAELLCRPWRQEHESVSAGFSRWVRTTLFEFTNENDTGSRAQLLDMERQVQRLQDDCDAAQQERDRIHRDGLEALERERRSKRELQTQLRECRFKEQELYEDIRRISQEKENLRRTSLEPSSHQTKVLQQRETEVGLRETKLRDLEGNLAEKQHQVAEANDRIRSLAQQLREKEMDMDARLATELRKYQDADKRLKGLIAQVGAQRSRFADNGDDGDSAIDGMLGSRH